MSDDATPDDAVVETKETPERLKAALAALPDDYVIVPKTFYAQLIESMTWTPKGNNGYGGWHIPEDESYDNMCHDFILLGALENDFELYEGMYGPEADW